MEDLTTIQVGCPPGYLECIITKEEEMGFTKRWWITVFTYLTQARGTAMLLSPSGEETKEASAALTSSAPQCHSTLGRSR